jgi:hypothetical protein
MLRSIVSFFVSPSKPRPSAAKKASRSVRPAFDMLEERAVPAIYVYFNPDEAGPAAAPPPAPPVAPAAPVRPPSDVAVTKAMDQASIALFQQAMRGVKTTYCPTGERVAGATPSAKSQIDPSIYLMSQASTSGGAAGADRPMESLSLNFAKMEFGAPPMPGK